MGGNPQSVVRAAAYGFNLMLAGLGMTPQRIAQYIDLFDRALEQFGHPRPLIGLSLTGHLADTDREARDQAWGPYFERMSKLSVERGFPVPTRASFEQSIDHSLNLIGAADTVRERVEDLARTLEIDRIDFGMDTGGLPLEVKHRSIALLGTGVAAPLAGVPADSIGRTTEAAATHSAPVQVAFLD
ncbi:LLM class flavin-dependent oxidoreductase [Microbacterium sp. RURRCA19A]|uniref:LLM class flavin-dependent oxidoreductase n=1 Tax=Microbacterium sp. RURRCA19A TaxID=1907391 RepID=UPI000954F645|nr:LLM class flavin-dependent oxidoreductase [Microbacterium sp. RURRCA19A]SIR97654.1 Luciferase-like monooxygenase [Microbacterium sp. RURRCA19A]